MIKVKRCKIKSKEKLKNIHKRSDTRLDLDCMFLGNGARKRGLLTVDYRIKVHMDLQVDKSPVVVKGEDHVWFEDRWMVASLCDE
jgi:hypothetical protein